MFTIDRPLELATTLTTGLADRILVTSKKGDLREIAALYNDMIFLQAAVEQLARPAIVPAVERPVTAVSAGNCVEVAP